jgi:hypothetical protein
MCYFYKSLPFNISMMKQTIALFIVLFLFKNTNAQEITVTDKTISIPGKQVILHTDGFPAMIQTSFKLITEPIHFHLPAAATHKDIKVKSNELKFTAKKPTKVSWTVINTSDSLNMEVAGSFNSKGELAYLVKFTALNNINLDDIRLHIPFTPEAAKYIKGLGQKAEARPEVVDWKWAAATKGANKVWVGDTNGGLQYELTDNQHKNIPASWSNSNKGGIHIEQKGKAILADNYSGDRHLKKGQVLYFNFTMLITDKQNSN